MFFNKEKNNYLFFEQLHIRHLNLLINLKNIKENNWFYKMALVNTFDDLKIFLTNLEKNKNKCTIAIQNNKIIGYVYTHPINDKKTCLKINCPKIIEKNISVTKRYLILNLIKNTISYTGTKTSNWIINSNIDDVELISSARELGFQPLHEIKLWKRVEQNYKISQNTTNTKIDNFQNINNSNIKAFLKFIRTNESILIRNILDLESSDIYNRVNNRCGAIVNNDDVIFAILKDISYLNHNVYSLIGELCWNEKINDILKEIIFNIFKHDSKALLETCSTDKNLNLYLSEIGLKEKKQELILVRNSLLKNNVKSTNAINNSLKSIIDKINPQQNPYPSPYPILYK